jgi:hypothetical protein
MDLVCLSELGLVGCHKADACVMMVLVKPGKETAAERAGLVDGFEPF